MLNRTLLKTVLATAVIATFFGLGACAEIAPSRATQELDKGVMYIYVDNIQQNKENIEHNKKLLDSEGLEEIGQMNEGVVVRKKDGSPGYWVRDSDNHNLYPVKPMNDAWIMTLSGMGQRDLDKKDAKDKETKNNAYDVDGGEGGGEGGGGD